MADETNVRRVLGELTGTEDDAVLRTLIDAIERTAVEEAFDFVAGETPLPSNMTDARALRLRRLCHHAKRPLTMLEIEVLFRISPAAARTVNTRMNATYPIEMRHLRVEAMKSMQDDATVTEEADGKVYRYKVVFGSPQWRELADTLLAEAGLSKGIERPNAQTIVFPTLMQGRNGDVNALTDVLGLSI